MDEVSGKVKDYNMAIKVAKKTGLEPAEMAQVMKDGKIPDDFSKEVEFSDDEWQLIQDTFDKIFNDAEEKGKNMRDIKDFLILKDELDEK